MENITLTQKHLDMLYETFKEIALDNFDSVFEAVEWTIEMMQKVVGSRRVEEEIPHYNQENRF
jgi:hypothetical protein